MKTKLTNYLRAGYSGLYVLTQEEERIEADLIKVTEEIGTQLYAWSASDGVVKVGDGSCLQGVDPFSALEVIGDLPENSTVLLRDFHPFLEEPNPMLHRKMKEVLRHGKSRGVALILAGCRLCIPLELERDMAVLDYPLPDKDGLKTVLENLAKGLGVTMPEKESCDAILEAGMGLTTIEAENAFALSLIEEGRFCPGVISREKAGAIRKDGLLEIVYSETSLDSVGGLDLLKEWLAKRRDAFGDQARVYGLPAPRGLMIIGVPGTGKSLTAKATAHAFGRPLLRLDVGCLFAGLVGESEANLRRALQITEAIAPCVLWLDEIEKAFGGTGNSEQDGGTSSRVFGTFLSWMQERTAPVFVAATANDVRRLPPELLRKGRFDEVFYVDLPVADERKAIWRIQIEKYGRNTTQYNLEQLVEASNGYTGSEIEQAYIDAMYLAFSRNEEPSMADLEQVMEEMVPFSRMMNEQLADLRRWANGRARMASEKDNKDLYRKVRVSD